MFVLLRVYIKKRVSKVLTENCIESWSSEFISPLSTVKGCEKKVIVKSCLDDLCLFRRNKHLKVFTDTSIYKYFSKVSARLLNEEAK